MSSIRRKTHISEVTMKKYMKNLMAFMVMFMMILPISTFAEEESGGGLADKATSALGGGVGMTFIDGVPFLNLAITPDLSFGPVGIGLDLILRVNTEDWSVRTSDWNDVKDIAKVIRYFRFGEKENKVAFGDKEDPFVSIYAKIGMLDSSSIGHGILMYNFSNSASIDDRSMGVEFDLDFNQVGLEVFTSDFTEAPVVGTRLYVRPLKFSPTLGAIPIIGGLEFGASYVSDLSEDSKVLTSTYDLTANDGTNTITKGNALSAYALDIGLPVLRLGIFDADIYYDYGKYVDYGSGSVAGFQTKLTLPGGILKISTKAERRWLNDKFAPSYFNALYLVSRYQKASSATSPARVLRASLDAKRASSGTYGEILFQILDKIQIVGGFQKDDRDPDGILHLETKLPPELLKIIDFSMSYDRVGIRTANDLFKLDENSLLSALIGYKPYSFLTIGVRYFWTFAPTADGGFETQQRIEPTISASMSF